MTVEIVSLSAMGEDGIAVFFGIYDGEHCQKERFIVGADAVARLRLRLGACSREIYDRVSEEADKYSALKRGLQILAYGSCSEKTLIQKLKMKGVSTEIAKGVACELVRRGYMDPHADATREAQRCLSKLYGKKRIICELYKKGYSDKDVRGAVYSLEDAEVDFAEICVKRLERTVDIIPTDPVERRKLISSLYRYGFSSEDIKEAFKSFASKKTH